MKPLRLTTKDVPLTVIYEGDKGEKQVYQIMPASRRFGLSMQGVTDQLKRLLLQRCS